MAALPMMSYAPGVIAANVTPYFAQGAAGLGAAAGVAASGYNAYKRARSWTQGASGPATKKRINKTAQGSRTEAGYAGRLSNLKRYKRTGRKRTGRKRTVKKRVRKSRKRVAKGENFYARSGGIATLEVSGSLSDTDCVYLGHSSIAIKPVLEMTGVAIARRLFKIGMGYESDNLRAVIPYRTTAGVQESGGCRILVKQVNTDTGVRGDVVFNLGTSETLFSVGQWFAGNILIYASAEETSTGAVERNNRLLWVELVDLFTGITRAHMDLTTMKVDMFSKSELKVQNVSVPTAAATETDNVANVPLVGRQYHMSNWQPVTVDDDMVVLNRLNQDTGILAVEIKPVSGTLGQQYNTWKEPPPSKVFVNCVSSAPLHLEPGTIKKHVSVLRRTMSLEHFLQALRVRRNNLNNKGIKLGRHDLFAFERMISMSGDLPLKINYECNIFTGITVTHRNKAAIMQVVEIQTQTPTLIPV